MYYFVAAGGRGGVEGSRSDATPAPRRYGRKIELSSLT